MKIAARRKMRQERLAALKAKRHGARFKLKGSLAPHAKRLGKSLRRHSKKAGKFVKRHGIDQGVKTAGHQYVMNRIGGSPRLLAAGFAGLSGVNAAVAAKMARKKRQHRK